MPLGVPRLPQPADYATSRSESAGQSLVLTGFVLSASVAAETDESLPQPGTIVRVNGVGAEVPPPGTSVTGFWDGPNQKSATITIVTMPDGVVSVNPPDIGSEPVRARGAITGNECTDSYQGTQGDEWISPWSGGSTRTPCPMSSA